VLLKNSDMIWGEGAGGGLAGEGRVGEKASWAKRKYTIGLSLSRT